MVVDSLIVQKKQETLVAVKKQAAKLIEEANAQADKLVEAAGNSPLKKIAAKKAAEELKSTAQKQADKLIKESEEKLK